MAASAQAPATLPPSVAVTHVQRAGVLAVAAAELAAVGHADRGALLTSMFTPSSTRGRVAATGTPLAVNEPPPCTKDSVLAGLTSP